MSEANSPLRVSEQELTKGSFRCVGYRQEGALCRNSTVSSDSHLEISHRPFLELWQPMSWLQSGHHVVNFFHLMEVSVLQDSSQDMAQNIIYSL